MKFVDEYTDLDWTGMSHVLVIPIQADHKKHRLENSLSFLYIRDLLKGDEYLIGCNHNDLYQNGEDWLAEVEWPEHTYCWHSSVLKQRGVKCFDVDMCYWLKYNEPIDTAESSEITVYHRWYRAASNVNNIVPVVAFVPFCQAISTQFQECVFDIEHDRVFKFYNNIVLDNYFKIENFGIPTNPAILSKFHNVNANKIYSEYFPYTSTGRPSNRFGGINFAAMNKSDGERSMIAVDGVDNFLMEFDYDSHHVRLAAKLIDYELPDGNLHHYFGRQYFNTPALTDKQYEESKVITFRMLNGRIPPEYHHIKFFKKIHDLHNLLWKQWNTIGYVQVPLSGRKIYASNLDNMSPNKVFNYILQAYETEVNNLMLRQVLEYLYGKQSELILYTYDSFLFKYNRNDGKGFIEDVKNILNQFHMQVSMKMGLDYHNMKTPKGFKK